MQYGPKIVTNGLVLALDAAEANSYGPIKAEVLVVAGGGAGGGYHGGGGGAGGVLYTSNYTIVRNTTYTVTVGQGGAGANGNPNTGDPGQNSIFSGASTVLTAVGGGAGKSQGNATQARNNGGSGGGGCDGNSSSITGGSGTAAQGFNGGDVSAESGPALAVYYGTAGGGGAGGVGGTGGIVNGGFGGPGLPFSISGTTQYYGGGGGGTNLTNILTYGIGGIGGGGTGGVSPSPHNSPLRYSTNGSANTGGGGGGYLFSGNGGGSGGSGIVIIRYKGPQKATGGTVTTVDNETVHTFTSSGSFVAGTHFADLSGNNNNGTLITDPLFNSSNGGSIVFDGTNDYVSITQNSNTRLQNNYQTLSFFVYITSVGPNTAAFLWNVGANPTGMFLFWSPTDINIQIQTGGTYISYPVTVTNAFNTWMNITYIINNVGRTMTAYKNGALVGTSSQWSIFTPPNSVVELGSNRATGNAGDYIRGRVANVLVYNRALTATEVLRNYNTTKARFGL